MKPRIVILEAIHADGVAALRRFAEVEIRLGLSRAALLDTIGEFDTMVIKSVTRVDAELLAVAPRLRVIGRAGTGLDNIDDTGAEARGIEIVTVPTGNTVSAAEFTIAWILGLCRRLPETGRAIADGDYRRELLRGRELATLGVGLVGLGNVGMAVARRLQPFGCRIMGYDPAPPDPEGFKTLGGILTDSLDVLLPQIDILSLHVRLISETRHLIDSAALARVKPGLLLVNTARGAVIDDAALLDALNDGRVAAAALDVLDPEPPFDAEPGSVAFDHPLLRHPSVTVTPHMAAETEQAQQRITATLVRKLEALLVR